MKSLPERIMEHAEATPEATPICPAALLHLGQRAAVGQARIRMSRPERARNPRIHFPDGFDRDGCKVDVWVSKWSDHSRAGWDLAHECVHLLDPIMEKYATYLEEGLATWYQDSPQLHPDYQNIRSLVQGHINGHPEGMRHKDPKYLGAKELVQKCMPEIKSAVRSIRKKGAKQPMCGIVRSRP